MDSSPLSTGSEKWCTEPARTPSHKHLHKDVHVGCVWDLGVFFSRRREVAKPTWLQPLLGTILRLPVLGGSFPEFSVTSCYRRLSDRLYVGPSPQAYL